MVIGAFAGGLVGFGATLYSEFSEEWNSKK